MKPPDSTAGAALPTGRGGHACAAAAASGLQALDGRGSVQVGGHDAPVCARQRRALRAATGRGAYDTRRMHGGTPPAHAPHHTGAVQQDEWVPAGRRHHKQGWQSAVRSLNT